MLMLYSVSMRVTCAIVMYCYTGVLCDCVTLRVGVCAVATVLGW